MGKTKDKTVYMGTGLRSWDEATDIIAKEIRRCIDTYGPTSIFCQGDGHGEAKLVHASHGCNTRLMDVLGG